MPIVGLLPPLRPTTSSSGNPSISLCMPGVLTDGGPRGLDDDRACRLRCVAVASLRGSSCTLSERMIASIRDDIVVVDGGDCCACEGTCEVERTPHHKKRRKSDQSDATKRATELQHARNSLP